MWERITSLASKLTDATTSSAYAGWFSGLASWAQVLTSIGTIYIAIATYSYTARMREEDKAQAELMIRPVLGFILGNKEVQIKNTGLGPAVIKAVLISAADSQLVLTNDRPVPVVQAQSALVKAAKEIFRAHEFDKVSRDIGSDERLRLKLYLVSPGYIFSANEARTIMQADTRNVEDKPGADLDRYKGWLNSTMVDSDRVDLQLCYCSITEKYCAWLRLRFSEVRGETKSCSIQS